MDTNPIGGNFYDEIASFLPTPGEYNLDDDLDEILRTTDSHLESSLDFTNFTPFNNNNNHHPQNAAAPITSYNNNNNTNEPTDTSNIQLDTFNFDFSTFPSPATTITSSGGTPPYNDSQHTISSSSSSSFDDNFNPDEFINFLNDDDVKLEEFTRDVMDMDTDVEMQRNTPSPTGSFASSSGSSTSGVQSDASSELSGGHDNGNGSGNGSKHVVDIEMQMKTDSIDEQQRDNCMQEIVMKNECLATTTKPDEVLTNFLATPAVLPIAVPVPMLTTPATNTTILQPIPQLGQPLNVLQNATLIPVKTVPLTTVTTVAAAQQPTLPPVKVEPKIAPKLSAIATTAEVKTSKIGNKTTNPTPATTKPKTIFLSSNDFKALMQKMNQPNSKSTKLTGGLNGQMPKLIMKTANGKVITANNKIVTTTTTTTATSQLQQQNSKSSAGNGGSKLLMKQQTGQQTPVKVSSAQAAAVKAAAAAAAASNGGAGAAAGGGSNNTLNIYKGILDEKMLKKQQRMIKNRESASLSRKKKKEYVVALETRISNLEKENFTLKGDNSTLRSQLVAFAQQCHCRNSNISEFILNSLNAANSNAKLANSLTAENVKIAPKSTGSTSSSSSSSSSTSSTRGIKQRMTAAQVRKNVAVLFAMAFMVTLNVGNFQNYLNKNSLVDTPAAGELTEESTSMSSGRRLLWVETESEFKEKLNRSKRETGLEMPPPPPLHFLRPINRTKTGGGRQFRGGGGIDGGLSNEPPPLVPMPLPVAMATSSGGSKCATINQANNQTISDNVRLHSNLHKWIDGNDYLNLSLYEKFGNDLNKGFKLDGFTGLNSNYLKMKNIDLPLQAPVVVTPTKRKLYLNPEMEIKQRKLNNTIGIRLGNPENGQSLENNNGKRSTKDNNDNNEHVYGKNSLGLFKPKLSEEYIRLFNGIKRKDDTFYVLSFNMDHILLPASAYNKSARPKMSLMLPAGDPSMNGDIVLMQIDCEVTNTTEIELKSEQIPEKLRPQQKYTTASDSSNHHHHHHNNNTTTTTQRTDVATNETTGTTMKSSLNQTPTIGAATEFKPKEKPVVRTYVMMGPKTKEAAEALKKEPTLVKLDASNESVLGTGILNIKNSTLFTKMRETVHGDFKTVTTANGGTAGEMLRNNKIN